MIHPIKGIDKIAILLYISTEPRHSPPMKNITKEIFLDFFEKHHPDKLKYKPKVIDIIGNNVVIEMTGHQGYFCVNVNNNIKSNTL